MPRSGLEEPDLNLKIPRAFCQGLTKTRSGPDEPDLNLKMPRAFCQGLTKTKDDAEIWTRRTRFKP